MDINSTPPIVVPSDITICENLYAKGTRKLTFMEKLGLRLTPKPIRLRYTKNDMEELISVLSKEYGDSEDAVVEILKARQQSISKQVKARTFLLGGSVGLWLLSLYSLRFSNVKTKVLVVPFATYFGSLIGRFLGDGFYGRWSEYTRDRALGALPAKRYLTEAEIKLYS